MLDKTKRVKLIIQNTDDQVLVYRFTKGKKWAFLSRPIKPGEFPEEAVNALIERVFNSTDGDYRLFKVLETNEAELHLYFLRLPVTASVSGWQMKAVTPVELEKLSLSRSDRLVAQNFARTYYGRL